MWRVGFPDDTRARIRVTDEALRLDEDGFEILGGQLEEADCVGLLSGEPRRSSTHLWVLLGCVLAIGVIVSIYGGGDISTPARENQTPTEETAPYGGEVSDGRSFGEVMAAEMEGRLKPNTNLTDRFNRL